MGPGMCCIVQLRGRMCDDTQASSPTLWLQEAQGGWPWDLWAARCQLALRQSPRSLAPWPTDHMAKSSQGECDDPGVGDR